MTPTGYSRTQIALHWSVAILIVAQFVLHDPIVAAWEAIEKNEAPDISMLVMLHVIGGSIILALAVWRLVLRAKRGVPALPESEAPSLKFFAHLTHWALYALMIVLPITGLAAWFGGSTTADFIHVNLKFALLALVALHVLGALFQQFVLKTGLINRMMQSQD
jgi:cytochrome b561